MRYRTLGICPIFHFRTIAVSEILKLLSQILGFCFQMLADCLENQIKEMAVPLQKYISFSHKDYCLDVHFFGQRI